MRRWAELRDQIRAQLRDPLSRNAYALAGSTIVTSGIGFVFWIVAAHIYSTPDVGIATALISTMTFLSGIAQLNLQTSFNRFVPTAGRSLRRLILLGYGITVVLTAATATVFVLGVGLGAWTPKLASVLSHGGEGVWFVISATIWTIFALEDAVLTGLGEAPWVLVENALYGILKLGILFVVAGRFPHDGIYIAWTVPLILCIAGVNRLVFSKLIKKRDHLPDEPVDARAIMRFISADFVVAVMSTGMVGLMPLIVLGVAGKSATAYVFLTYTISSVLFLLSLNFGQSMITEVAQAPERLMEYVRKTIKQSLALVVPLALGLAISAPLALRLVGKGYATHATVLLQLFALSAIPGVFVVTYVCVMRAKRAMSAVMLVVFVQSAGTLVLMEVFLHTMGISGVGVAWLVVQSAIGAYLLLGEFRTLWLPFVRPTSLRDVAARVRLTSGSRPRRGVVKVGLETLEASGLASRGWVLEDFIADKSDVCVLGVKSEQSGERAILKVATTERGPEALKQEGVALRAVYGCAPPKLSDLLPHVLETGVAPRAWTLETRGPGVDARAAADRPETLEPLLADLVERMSSLYVVGAASLPIDDAAFTRLVDKPLAAAEVLNTKRLRMGSDAQSFAKLRAELHAELMGRDITMSLTHGNLWLGNVRWEPLSGKVTGIVDWRHATVEPPAVDIAHLLCMTRASVERRELGSVVRTALASGSLPEREEELIRSLPGSADISIRTALLLAWLRHVSDNAVRGPDVRVHELWLEHNVHQVLESV